MRTTFITGISLILLLGCGNEDNTNSNPSGVGGQSSSVANTGQGGGTTAVGSSNPTGGAASATGGADATGGSRAAAGGDATGGKAGGGTTGANTGGAKATGGATSVSTGGTKAAGGTTGANTGGAKATGGATSVSTGGSNAAGGATSVSTGGTKAGGGTTAVSTGGNQATGGTSSAGGQASFKCANLTFKPSTTGKSKPSGPAGGLKVIDWAGFSSAISYTFDDANQSQINNYAAMKTAGGHYTFYLQTGKTSEASNNIWKTAIQDGHELGNHTVDHSKCNNTTAIDSASTFIKTTFNVTPFAFAAPEGSTACKTASVQSKFLTDRSVDGGGTMGPGDVNSLGWLPADIPPTNGSNMAPASGKWRVICIHGFQDAQGSNKLDGAYQAIPLNSFTSAVQSAVSGGSWVEHVTNVAAYQWGQNAISKGTGTSATWTLPSVFPSDMCVRVTTSGGTVKQNGVEVPWDEHGYYEISLDAKSVTVE